MNGAELRERDVGNLPGRRQGGWWLKTVQLDLEAKGLVARTRSSPLRVHRNR